MIERTVVIIKPEGHAFRSQIIQIVTCDGLRVIDSFFTRLPKVALEQIYADAVGNSNLWATLLRYLENKCCEFLLIEGDEAIGKVLKATGSNLDPRFCEPGTIRFCFGRDLEPIPIPGYVPGFHCNIVHRSRDRLEGERDLKIFRQLKKEVS